MGERVKLHLPLPVARLTTGTIPPPSVEKLSPMKPVPGARKVGDCWCRENSAFGGREEWPEKADIKGFVTRLGGKRAE